MTLQQRKCSETSCLPMSRWSPWSLWWTSLPSSKCLDVVMWLVTVLKHLNRSFRMSGQYFENPGTSSSWLLASCYGCHEILLVNVAPCYTTYELPNLELKEGHDLPLLTLVILLISIFQQTAEVLWGDYISLGRCQGFASSAAAGLTPGCGRGELGAVCSPALAEL